MQLLDPKDRRDYISWSAYSLFKRDPEEYKRKYLYGEPQYTSNAMRIGTSIHEAIAGKGDVPGVDLIKIMLPTYKEHEHYIKRTIEGITLLGYIDLYSETPKNIKIGEIKTGKAVWTQNKANNHGQLVFYNLLASGTKPIRTELYWIRTDGQNITGDIKTFKVEVKKADMYKLFADIKRTQKEINKLWDIELKKYK
jgi:cellulose synthase/poly-beta-1,6-N-acetylglucosamine synthase-like glycosyltransferase